MYNGNMDFFLGLLKGLLKLMFAPLGYLYSATICRMKSIKKHRNVFTFVFELCIAISCSIFCLGIVMLLLTANKVNVFQSVIVDSRGEVLSNAPGLAQLFVTPTMNEFGGGFMGGVYIFAGSFVILTALPYKAVIKREKLRHVGVAASSIDEFLKMNNRDLKKAIREKHKKLNNFQFRLHTVTNERYQVIGIAAEKKFKSDFKGGGLYQEVNLSNDNFDAFADFTTRGTIYEIKSTKHAKGSKALTSKIKNKYSLQLKLYLYLSKRPKEGGVIVYNNKLKPQRIYSEEVALSPEDRKMFEELEKRIMKVKSEIYAETHKHFRLYLK